MLACDHASNCLLYLIAVNSLESFGQVINFGYRYLFKYIPAFSKFIQPAAQPGRVAHPAAEVFLKCFPHTGVTFVTEFTGKPHYGCLAEIEAVRQLSTREERRFILVF